MSYRVICTCPELGVKYSGSVPSNCMLKTKRTATVECIQTAYECAVTVKYNCGAPDGHDILVRTQFSVIYRCVCTRTKVDLEEKSIAFAPECCVMFLYYHLWYFMMYVRYISM